MIFAKILFLDMGFCSFKGIKYGFSKQQSNQIAMDLRNFQSVRMLIFVTIKRSNMNFCNYREIHHGFL